MTHFTVALIVPPDRVAGAEDFIARQMAPYDENVKVEPYVCYSVEHARQHLADTIHRLGLIVARREPVHDLGACAKNLDELRRADPEEKYREYLKHHDRFNAQGQPISSYNPKSKWDWYCIGGRWDGWIKDRETASGRLADNLATTEEVLARDKIPHAVMTPDGVWHERGRVGWFAILTSENENWDAEARDLFARHQGHHVVLVDAHI